MQLNNKTHGGTESDPMNAMWMNISCLFFTRIDFFGFDSIAPMNDIIYRGDISEERTHRKLVTKIEKYS